MAITQITNKPFNIVTLLFDFLISVGLFLIVSVISIIIGIAWTGSREDGLGIGMSIGLPISTLTFYLVRRQQTILLTIIQAILATGLLFLWLTFSIKCLEHFHIDNYDYFILIAIPIISTLTKHSLDKIINLTRNKNSKA